MFLKVKDASLVDTVEREKAVKEYKPPSCWLQLDFSSSKQVMEAHKLSYHCLRRHYTDLHEFPGELL